MTYDKLNPHQQFPRRKSTYTHHYIEINAIFTSNQLKLFHSKLLPKNNNKMTIEYIELKENTPNIFWNSTKPAMFLDQNLCVEVPEDTTYHYSTLMASIKKHDSYCLRSLNKKNLLLEFMPFASRKLRTYLDKSNSTQSQVPLITSYLGSSYIYVSHNHSAALLKVSNEEVTNDFLDVIDNLYGIH